MSGPKKNISFIVYCLLIVSLIGCAKLKEGARGFLGISTKVLEDGRKDAIKKSLPADFNTVYERIKQDLIRIEACIYAQDKQKKMIAVYLSESDTTPVGIFFRPNNTDSTLVEVSSPSTYAKEFIAAKIFAAYDFKAMPSKTEEIKIK